MEGDRLAEEERQGLINQLRLDLLLRRLGSTVLRRKFKEIYAKFNDGKEWTDSTEAGEKFCRGKWGSGAFSNAKGKQREMMEGGNIQNWDLNCLQSVILQMLMTAFKEMKEAQNRSSWENRQPKPINWDQRWWAQMSKIRQLANIRHSVAHMPNETLSLGEFEEKWENAVEALKGLGAKTKEINEIRQISQSALSFPTLPPRSQQGQGQTSTQNDQGQTQVIGETKESKVEESQAVEEFQTKFESLQLEIPTPEIGEDEIKDQQGNEVKGQSEKKELNSVIFNKKNESKANSLMRRGDSAGRSRDWDKALEFYTRALDNPKISNDLKKNIFINRSWVHLKILQRPETPFNLTFPLSGSGEPEAVNLTEELKDFHLTVGMADAELALQLSPGQNSPTAFYRLAQFHQLKGDWRTALTFFDRALGQSNLDDLQLESDRNACQLEVLNQTEVEEFRWIPGQKNQTMAGLDVRRNPQSWTNIMNEAVNSPQQQHKLYAHVVKGHFLAQGLSLNVQGQTSKKSVRSQRTIDFNEVVKLYEEAANGGLPSGIYNLGLLLQEGNGVPQSDYSGAIRLFKMAAQFPIDEKSPSWAKEGILKAQYRLGLCYEFGLGLGKDEKKALHWYEMASMKEFARASRKLGDIYVQGLLGVSKDMDMAIFCWENAAVQGDMLALTFASTQLLESYADVGDTIRYSLYNFSEAILSSSRNGTRNMLAAVLVQKQQYEWVLSTVLEEISQTQSDPDNPEVKGNDHEPEEVSWNVPAFVEHTLHTIHLLELAQAPEFQQKLQTIPYWRKKFQFTDKLMQASNSCTEGLAALEELNKMYRETLINAKANRNQGAADVDTEYPPNLREIPGIDKAIFIREGQLKTVILSSFRRSIDLVGAVSFRDQPSQTLIQDLVQQTLHGVEDVVVDEEYNNCMNAALITSYTLLLRNDNSEHILDLFDLEGGPDLPFYTIGAAVVQGSLGKFEMAAGDLEKAFKKSADPRHPHNNSRRDLLFIQALCCKSAGLTRGVNSASRKKVKEAMSLFQKFLSISPKDDPRRAEAHYQLGLCTLYLEKLKVKGQVKSSTKDILGKVQPHFAQGEEAEQEFPWKEFPLPPKSSVKLLLQQKMNELQALEDVAENSENLPYVRLVDHFYKFPASSFPIKVRAKRRVEVITQFRKFYKEAREHGIGPSSSPDQLANLLSLIGTSFSEPNVLIPTIFVGCYEIVEPVFHFPASRLWPKDTDSFRVFTVVQDESGAVFNLQFSTKYPGIGDVDKDGQIGMFRMGTRIIVHEPLLQLDVNGETSLVVRDTEAHIFHLPSTSEYKQRQGNQGKEHKLAVMRKCGFCGKIGERLQFCSKCKMVYYCNRECQKADWTELKHIWICPSLQQLHLSLNLGK